MSTEWRAVAESVRARHRIAWEIVGFFLDQPLIVIVLALALLAGGFWVAPFDIATGLDRDPVPVDAIPDIGENQQIVFTDWPGRSARDVEDQVTYPLTVALLNVPGAATVRSTSMFGFSVIYVLFEESADFWGSRSRIMEKLASLPPNSLPEGAVPRLGPDATPLGQIFWYTLEGRDSRGHPTGGWDLDELRAIQDYQVRYALAAADGVAEVASIGGFVREYQIDVDPELLRAHGATLEEVFAAARESNREVGARTIEINGAEYVVRGLGYVRDAGEIESAWVRSNGIQPVRIGDVARVTLGPAVRGGALDRGGAEVVGGVVVARHGSNPMEVIGNVRRAMERVQRSLPARALEDGTVSQITIVPFYDRSGLIRATLGTLEDAIWQQVLITVLVVLGLLVHVRSSILISSLLPFAVCFAFLLMKATGVDANVISLAGIAIAIGTLVDVGIVLVENIVRHMRHAGGTAESRDVVQVATAEVGAAVAVSISTTIAGFLPVFLLTGEEGRLFRPLAFTKTFALVGSLAIAVVLLPPLARLLMRAGSERPAFRRAGWIVSAGLFAAGALLLADAWMPLGAGAGGAWNALAVALVVLGLLGFFSVFRLVYAPLLRWILGHRLLFLSAPGALLLTGLTAWFGFPHLFGWLPHAVHRSSTGQWLHHHMPGLGREFMPQLDEGAFLFMPSAMPHASLQEAVAMVREIDARIESIPEVESAIGKVGRVESALDPAPPSMFEVLIAYRPEYAEDADGRRLRFRVDESGEFERDRSGNLVPDPSGRPWRNWRPEIQSRDDIWNEIVRAANVPGVTSASLLQPISARLVMLQSGIRANMAVRLHGARLEDLEAVALAVGALIRQNPQVAPGSVVEDRPVGTPYIEIRPDREALVRWGVSMSHFQDVVEMAVGGMDASQAIHGRERLMIRVRYPRELRDSPDAIGRVLVDTMDGGHVPLSELATVAFTGGPWMIRAEDAELVNFVMFDGRPGLAEMDVVESVARDLERALSDGSLRLPDGVSYSFAGAWENGERARARLAIILPGAVALIFLIIYIGLRSVTKTVIVFSSMAVTLSGGLLLVWAFGQSWFLDATVAGVDLRELLHVTPVNLSVAVWVGFLALFGIATDDGVLQVTYIDESLARAPATTPAALRERVVEAGRRRIRACLMTNATTIIALLPILTSRGTGADVMLPMALPSLGGMSIDLISLFVTPALYSLWAEWSLGRVGRQGRMGKGSSNSDADTHVVASDEAAASGAGD